MRLHRSRLVLAVASIGSIALAHATIGFASSSLAAADGSGAIHPAPGPTGMLLATTVLLALAVVLGLRLPIIAVRAAAHGPAGVAPQTDHLARYTIRAAGVWGRLFVASSLLFLLLEGGEAVLDGRGLVGSIPALITELAIAFPAVAAASLLLAATLALASWCHCALTKGLGRRPLRPHRAGDSSGTRLHLADVARVSSLLAADPSGRSPPPGFALPA